jgi:hypothetical protein
MNPSQTRPDVHGEVPGLEGPDYVALVIEWEEADAATLVRNREPRRAMGGKIVGIIGALLALGVATWGLHRLRTS